MDFTVENNEDNTGVSIEKPEENSEGSSKEKTTDTVEETGENAVGNKKVDDRNLEDKLNSEVSNENAEESTDRDAIEIVEIEEKVTIETLDEATDVQESVEVVHDMSYTTADDKVDLTPSGDENRSQTDTTEPPQEEEKQDEWFDLLGNGLLKKKVSRVELCNSINIVHDTGLHRKYSPVAQFSETFTSKCLFTF